MTFITQCPHADCRKYMLLEDDVRGTQIECMVCKRPIQLFLDLQAGDAVAAGRGLIEVARPTRKDAAPAAVTDMKTKDKFKIKDCPKCKTPLRVPLDNPNQAVQCTECNFWGIVS
jgi:hypothetical protein